MCRADIFGQYCALREIYSLKIYTYIFTAVWHKWNSMRACLCPRYEHHTGDVYMSMEMCICVWRCVYELRL